MMFVCFFGPYAKLLGSCFLNAKVFFSVTPVPVYRRGEITIHNSYTSSVN